MLLRCSFIYPRLLGALIQPLVELPLYHRVGQHDFRHLQYLKNATFLHHGPLRGGLRLSDHLVFGSQLGHQSCHFLD